MTDRDEVIEIALCEFLITHGYLDVQLIEEEMGVEGSVSADARSAPPHRWVLLSAVAAAVVIGLAIWLV